MRRFAELEPDPAAGVTGSTESSDELEHGQTTGAPDVSVVIPVKNGAPEIRTCLDGILAQSIRPREIIVIDSGSTDGTMSILREYPDIDVIRIAPGEFNHGETRNAGARRASGEFVLFTVSDARAAGADWIAELFRGFTDKEVAAVCGSQIVPHERDKNPVEWFRPSSEPRTVRHQFGDPKEFDRLPVAEKARICGWDDVTAMYRRSVLLDLPFRRTTYAEDLLWASDAIRRGHALVYNGAARVFHYHSESPDFAFRRSLTAIYHRHKSVGYVPDTPDLLLPAMRTIYQLVRESSLSWSERFHWGRYNIRNGLARRAAVRAFRGQLAHGQRALDELHQLHCGLQPTIVKSASRVSA